MLPLGPPSRRWRSRKKVGGWTCRPIPRRWFIFRQRLKQSSSVVVQLCCSAEEVSERVWTGDSRRTEVTVLAFVRSHAVWYRLLGLAVFKCAKVEGPVPSGL